MPFVLMDIRRIGNIYDERFNTGYAGNVYDRDGVCPTIRTPTGGGNIPMTIVEQTGDCWMSDKGVEYILNPKRGGWNKINPEIAVTVAAKGNTNWIGTFLSHDILAYKTIDKKLTLVVDKDMRLWTNNGKGWRQP